MESSLITLAVVMTLVELAAGISLGWWLRGSNPPLATTGTQGEDELQRARTALSTLHELASSVAADVGEHNSRVQAMNLELTQHSAAGAIDADVLNTVAKIIEANERLNEQLKSAEARLQEQAHQIEVHAADALTDALTNIPNRRYFDTELHQRLAEWNRKGVPVCLIMSDVDHFKKFNDTHGHLAGDEVLRGVAGAIRATIRDMDIVARYGGEEFAIILPASTLQEAEAGALRLCPHLETSQFHFEGKTLKVTISGGLAQAATGEDETSLIKRADEALYAAKKAGRNRIYTHDGKTIRPIGSSGSLRPATKPPDAKTPSAAALKSAETKAGAGAGASSAERGPVEAAGADSQTGLPNRTSLCDELRRRVAESQRYDSKLSLMLVNVDGFERVSDEHGQAAVDLVVKTVSQFLTAGMREMDLVARYSDKVFGVLLPGTPLDQAVGVAERLRGAVARCPLKSKDFELRMTVSTGLAEANLADDWTGLLARAQAAMQSAIDAGQDCTRVHDGKEIECSSPNELAV